ncbi:MAG: GTP-binding protein [Euryarchaeota archaeon]|nr:GTP-binding protein [Euryarchaeota archaeon]
MGEGAVGKTSLVRRFVLDLFSDDYLMTIGAKVMKKELTLRDGGTLFPITMTIRDILGQKGYAGVQEAGVKGAQAVLLVYDVTQDDSWRALEEYWIPIVWRLVGKIPLVFAGNKVDLAPDKTYTKDVLGYLEQKYEARGFLRSTKTGENVEATFDQLGRAVLRSLDEPVTRIAQPTPPVKAPSPILAVTDKIMTDFCAGFGGLETGMNVVRQQFEKAGVDVRTPTKEGLLRVVDLLSEIEKSVKPLDVVSSNRLKRISWMKALP